MAIKLIHVKTGDTTLHDTLAQAMDATPEFALWRPACVDYSDEHLQGWPISIIHNKVLGSEPEWIIVEE